MTSERVMFAADALWNAMVDCSLPRDIKPDDRKVALLHLASYIVGRCADDDPELTSGLVNKSLEECGVGWRLVPLQ